MISLINKQVKHLALKKYTNFECDEFESFVATAELN